jgi:hypothetical protein
VEAGGTVRQRRAAQRRTDPPWGSLDPLSEDGPVFPLAFPLDFPDLEPLGLPPERDADVRSAHLVKASGATVVKSGGQRPGHGINVKVSHLELRREGFKSRRAPSRSSTRRRRHALATAAVARGISP